MAEETDLPNICSEQAASRGAISEDSAGSWRRDGPDATAAGGGQRPGQPDRLARPLARTGRPGPGDQAAPARSSGWNSRTAPAAAKPSPARQSPTLVDLVLNKITVEYHETLSAAAGFQVEEAKQDAMKKYAGQYVLVVEGQHPRSAGRHLLHHRRAERAVDLLQKRPPARRPSSPPATAPPSAASRRPSPIPTGAQGRRRDHHGQAGRQHPRLPGHPRSLHRDAGPLPGLRRPARTG